MRIATIVRIVLIALAVLAVILVQTLFLPVKPGLSIIDPRHKDDLTVQVTGGDEHGTMLDNYYGGPNHDVYIEWDMGKREEVGSGNAVWSKTTFTIATGDLPDTPDGHTKCVQAAVDWRIPPFANHYDMRRMVVCKPHSAMSWTFSERDTDNSTDGGPEDCVGAREVPCVSPMGRVQMSMYVPYYFGTDRAIVGPIQCRVFPGGVALSDCKSWHPWGQLASSRTKIMYSGGGIDYVGSLNATSPDQ